MDAILLDLDGTLLDDRFATHKALSAFMSTHRPHLRFESESESLLRWQRVSALHWLRFERGEISFHEQRRARVREFLDRSLSDAEADAAFEPYRQTYERSWSLVPECAEFLRRTCDVPKIIITNGEREQQRRKVEMTGLHAHVVATVTPFDCGHWKPAQGIFLAALALLDVEPARCLMIGDDALRDIEPAQQLGMRSFLVVGADKDRTLLHALDGRP